KTTNKQSTKKADDAKPAKAAAVPKSTAKPSAEKTKGAAEEAPAAQKVVKETVSLIEPKQKTKRTRTPSELEHKPFARIPISRILEPEAPKAAPAPAPAAPAVEAPASAAPEAPTAAPAVAESAAAVSDEKVIHLKPPF